MNYIDWVALVAGTFADLRPGTTKIVGIQELRGALGLGSEAENGVFTAVSDLDSLTILDMNSLYWLKGTDNTRRLRAGGSLTNLWPAFFDRLLEPDEEVFLAKAVELAQRPGDSFADVEWVEHPAVFSALGWDSAEHSADEIGVALEGHGFIEMSRALGGPVKLRPRYAGLVRSTQRLATEWQQRVAAMIHEWETTTVEFKRELPLGTEKQKAEFGHDIIALANTKSSGATRYMVVGFDSTTHAFTTPIDRRITQDRLEQILDSYTSPMPTIRLITFPESSGGGEIGVIEVRRDLTRMPHRMVKGGGKVQVGQVFVRHGAHVVTPDVDELTDLEAEGEKARAEAVR